MACFFFGIIKDGLRHVLVGEAVPSLRNMKDLTIDGAEASMYDWGANASEPAAYNLANLVLSELVADKIQLDQLTPMFAKEVVVPYMDSGISWMLLVSTVDQWIQNKCSN